LRREDSRIVAVIHIKGKKRGEGSVRPTSPKQQERGDSQYRALLEQGSQTEEGGKDDLSGGVGSTRLRGGGGEGKITREKKKKKKNRPR